MRTVYVGMNSTTKMWRANGKSCSTKWTNVKSVTWTCVGNKKPDDYLFRHHRVLLLFWHFNCSFLTYKPLKWSLNMNLSELQNKTQICIRMQHAWTKISESSCSYRPDPFLLPNHQCQSNNSIKSLLYTINMILNANTCCQMPARGLRGKKHHK